MEKREKIEIIEMKGITKRFPGVTACDHIDLVIKAGEIHAIVGENGAGKTTLMNILYGLLRPDEGEIFINGRKVELRSPKDAIELGIGMVHQHFMLIDSFTVVENIIIGLKSSKWPILDTSSAEKKIMELSEKYGLEIKPNAKIWQLSVGERQRVEIIKALYRGANVLILDEPTSVLTPSEVTVLSKILVRMARQGMAIVPFISHKLPEVMSISDRVTVLRKGKVVGRFETKKVDAKTLARHMVGREVLFRLSKGEYKAGEVILEVRDLCALSDIGVPALKGVSFSVRRGEIFGVAGVAGNGQHELVEAIAGLRKVTAGKVLIDNIDVTNSSPIEIAKLGLAYIPEDRLKVGFAQDLSAMENAILDLWYNPPFKKKWLIDYTEADKFCDRLISEYNIIVPRKLSPVRFLSGGNLQKLLLARELSRGVKILMVEQPTHGLDVSATEFVRKKLVEHSEKGVAILLISNDLDEVMSLSDRIAVFFKGEIMGIVPAQKVTIEDIGAMMTGVKKL